MGNIEWNVKGFQLLHEKKLPSMKPLCTVSMEIALDGTHQFVPGFDVFGAPWTDAFPSK